MTRRPTWLLLALLLGCGQGPRVLTDPAAWSPHPADGVDLVLADDGGALRLDFEFGGGGWALARREVALDLPANYEFRFRLMGDAPVNHLEFKLVDASGENVWWHVWRDVAWPDRWTTFTLRKRQIEFAWGPQGGGELTHVAALEIAVTAGEGGRGTVWIDELELVARPVVTGPPPPPVARATSARSGHGADFVLDGDPATTWRPAADDLTPVLELDLRRAREFGGLTVDWSDGRHATEYVVEARDAPNDPWRELRRAVGANGGRDELYLPESEAVALRLRPLIAARDDGVAVGELIIRPPEWSATRNVFFENVAADARRGLYPRGFVPEQVYWTVVGADDDAREGLVSEDGAIEAGPGSFTLEPFLTSGDSLVTWADVRESHTLVDADLPLPRVSWRHGPWHFGIEVDPVGAPGASALRARYVVANLGSAAAAVSLHLAVRPFQVNPPSQVLNVRGGTASIGSLARDGLTLLVDGQPRVILARAPAAFGATTFAGGDVVAEHLARGELPAAAAVIDPFGAASGAASYPLELAAGESDTIAVLIPLHELVPASWPTDDPRPAWRAARDRVRIEGPPPAADALATLRAQLGYILVNRAGVAIQPGARSYARSWIRDGSLTGTALLRLGHTRAAVDFLEWYAPHQYPSGKIPCVVDHRGADPVPEHDSTGEFIHLVAECYRFTRDRSLLEGMWPRVLAGVDYLEELLATRRTHELRGTPYFGILPPSISHEGYSAKPMHSYWDDAWAWRGLADAAWLAGELGDPGAADLAAARDRFGRDFGDSILAAIKTHGIDYVPGCADLGDFDPTSTTILVSPTGAAPLAPGWSIQRTFERYWEFFIDRRDTGQWAAMTPYEIRNVGAFVRLGWRERAHELLEWFLGLRRPAGWLQWAEVVARDARAARFLGDMPHTWVGSDYVRSLLDMFAYERRESYALVVAAGVPDAWLVDGGVRITALPTPWGALSYALWRDGDLMTLAIEAGPEIPAGGLILRPPVTAPIAATIDGAPATMDPDGGLTIRRLPARVEWFGP